MGGAGFWTEDCLLCSAPSEAMLCSACIHSLPRLPETHCRVCALPLATGDICGACLVNPPFYDAIFVLFRYVFPVDRLIQHFKYGHYIALAPFFARLLHGALGGVEADYLLPLPLHPERLKARGFNQALELARPLQKELNIPLRAALCTRVRATPQQVGLSLKEREKNMQYAFEAHPAVLGKRIILVDDVMTTGASLNACAKALKAEGAASVYALVLSRAW